MAQRRSTGMNPGQALFNRIYRKKGAQYPDTWTDFELLAALFGREAARSILDACKDGTLEGFSGIGEGKNLRDAPGVGPGTAAKLDVLYELSCRIS